MHIVVLCSFLKTTICARHGERLGSMTSSSTNFCNSVLIKYLSVLLYMGDFKAMGLQLSDILGKSVSFAAQAVIIFAMLLAHRLSSNSLR